MGPIWWQAVVAVAIIAVCAIAGVSGALSGGGSEGSVPMITLASEKLISVQGHASFNLTLSAPLGMLDVVNETVHFEFTVGDRLISESGKPAGGPCLVGLTSLANNYADSPNLNERGVLDAANETVFQHVAVDPAHTRFGPKQVPSQATERRSTSPQSSPSTSSGWSPRPYRWPSATARSCSTALAGPPRPGAR